MDSVTKALMQEFVKKVGFDDLPESKQFEHFATFCIVSAHHNDDFDTDDLVGGDGQDLNIDGFAVKVNGRLAHDQETIKDLLELNGYLEVEFIVIQAKTTSGFDGSAFIALGDNLVNEIFADDQKLPMNDEIRRLIEIKSKIYENASKLKENPKISIYYACTGNWKEDAYISGVINRKKGELEKTNLFSQVNFEPVDAKNLQTMYRNTKISISRKIIFDKLITLPSINDVSASYLGVLPVSEYIKLITDNDGDILKSVFVDNVRDFQGVNAVNEDIAKTIQDKLFDQFVLRNNGITIVARDIRVTSNQFTLEDYQVVNGCQTSHVIFANHGVITGELLVPVKLIHTTSDDVAQAIIKSTNKQTKVEDNDLLALTQFQRDLEDYFSSLKDDKQLFYERRAKQYANATGLEKGRITTIGSQLKSFASMFLEAPHQAGRYQGTLLKSVKNQVFRPNHNPEAYYTAAFAYYRFEVSLRKLSVEQRIMRSFKYYLLLAFRYRYEMQEFPGAGGKKIGVYCDHLNAHLYDMEKVKTAFEECVEIVICANKNLNLELARDSAKSRPLVDEVRRVAQERNSNIKADSLS